MKAAVLTEIGKPLVITDVPRPQILPDEVLVQTHSCGICRTDVHIQDGLAYIPSLPHIPGHEPAGVVVEVGSRVTNIRPGQRVTPHLFFTCGTCHYCRSGRDCAMHARQRHPRRYDQRRICRILQGAGQQSACRSPKMFLSTLAG